MTNDALMQKRIEAKRLLAKKMLANRQEVPPVETMDDPSISGIEAIGRGAFYGALQQPRDVIAALTAKIGGGVPFKEGLAAAREMSLEGKQGQAKEERPGYFGTGSVAGNIALTAVPGMAATKAIGMAAPVLSKAPVIGTALSKTAQGIAASKGIAGIPLAGGIQGGISTLASEGDLSGVLPGMVGAGAVGALGKVARPIGKNAASIARKGFTNTLKAAGIDDLTAAQMTGDKTLEIIDSVLASLPFTAGKSRDLTEKQLRKFTAAALKKAGLSGDDISPAVREAAEAQFSQRYGDLINNEIVNIDMPVVKVLREITQKQLNKIPTNVKPIIQSYIDDIVQSGGQLTGEGYQVARSQLGQQARSMAISDPFTANILRKLKTALDGAAERSLPSAKKGAWKVLNRQYANYKIIQKASSSVSQDSLEGLLSPKALMSAVETANKTKGQKGYGDLYGLARSGRSVLADSVPNSGTAQRQLVQNIMTGGGIGIGAGGATYGMTQDPEKAALAMGLTLGGPSAIQAFINSAAGRRYLTKGIPGITPALESQITKIMAAITAAQATSEGTP